MIRKADAWGAQCEMMDASVIKQIVPLLEKGCYFPRTKPNEVFLSAIRHTDDAEAFMGALFYLCGHTESPYEGWRLSHRMEPYTEGHGGAGDVLNGKATWEELEAKNRKRTPLISLNDSNSPNSPIAPGETPKKRPNNKKGVGNGSLMWILAPAVHQMFLGRVDDETLLNQMITLGYKTTHPNEEALISTIMFYLYLKMDAVDYLTASYIEQLVVLLKKNGASDNNIDETKKYLNYLLDKLQNLKSINDVKISDLLGLPFKPQCKAKFVKKYYDKQHNEHTITLTPEVEPYNGLSCKAFATAVTTGIVLKLLHEDLTDMKKLAFASLEIGGDTDSLVMNVCGLGYLKSALDGDKSMIDTSFFDEMVTMNNHAIVHYYLMIAQHTYTGPNF